MIREGLKINKNKAPLTATVFIQKAAAVLTGY